VDLREDRVVTKEQAEKVAKKLNMLGYMETSAKAGTNVKTLFQTISELLLQHTTRTPQ
jgi:GTPase SAR1 family protein